MNNTFLNRLSPIQAGVIFGNPQKNCAGHGICKVTSPAALSACGCFSATAFLSFIPETTIISFFFPNALNVRSLLEIYFKGEHFVVEEEVSFKLEDLGSDGGEIIIQKGGYLPEQNEEGVHLFLSYRLRQQDNSVTGYQQPKPSIGR